MDEFDLMKELYGTPDEPEEPETPDEDDEIQLNIRDYRSDDAFERMLAELNGKYSSPRPSAMTAGGVRKFSEAVQPKENSEQTRGISVQQAEDTPHEAVEAMAVMSPPEQEAVAEPEPAPSPPPPKPEVKRKKPPEKKSPEQLEMDRRERERKAEQELFERREREARERERQFIEKISNIWNTPEFAEGGRVEMNIRTDERKEIRITVPTIVTDPPQEQNQKGEKDELDYTPLIPQRSAGEENAPKAERLERSPEEEKRLLEEAARRDAQNRTEKAASRKISIRKKR